MPSSSPAVVTFDQAKSTSLRASTLSRKPPNVNDNSNADNNATSPSSLRSSPHFRSPSAPAISIPRTASVRSGNSITTAPKSPTATPALPPAPPAPLAHRLFFPQLPPSQPLPPILISEPTPGQLDELNAELYDFLALAIRGFVLPWWTPLSHGDRDLAVHIGTICTHLIRAIEVRARAADLPAVLLRDLPVLITQHYRDYRHAKAKLSTAYISGAPNPAEESDYTLPHVFHRLQPHIAVSPDGTISQTYLRQAVEHIMRTCLPPEDWESVPERAIVREIVVGPVLGSVLPKLAQPWFLHHIALTLLGRPMERSPRVRTPSAFSHLLSRLAHIPSHSFTHC